MMGGSDFTKICRRKLWFWRILDIVILIGPLFYYFFAALANGGVTAIGKISVVGTVAIALVLVLFNVIAQKRLRCPIWIVLIGFYIAVKDWLLPLIIMLAVSSILDDLFITPIISYYRSKLIANKAIDEREAANGTI